MTRDQLLPPEIAARMPKVDAVRTLGIDAMEIVCKWFYPDFGWTWYVIAHVEGDVYFGLVDGFEAELGDFSLAELMATRGKLGCEIERDLYFDPQPLLPIYRAACRRRSPARSN